MSQAHFAGAALPGLTNAFFFSSAWRVLLVSLGCEMNSASGESFTPFLANPVSQTGPSGRGWGLAVLSPLQRCPASPPATSSSRAGPTVPPPHSATRPNSRRLCIVQHVLPAVPFTRQRCAWPHARPASAAPRIRALTGSWQEALPGGWRQGLGPSTSPHKRPTCC